MNLLGVVLVGLFSVVLIIGGLYIFIMDGIDLYKTRSSLYRD